MTRTFFLWYTIWAFAGMMKLVDMRDLGSRASRRAGSSPVTRTTSEQAAYRLLRLFSKVRARSLRCSSFPNRTRFAGLRFGFGRNLERKSILTPYSSSEIPTTVPFPASPKTALWWEFLRFPPRLASLDSRRKGNGENREGRKIDFVRLLHDKMTDYTKGVVCHLLLEHTQPITPQ